MSDTDVLASIGYGRKVGLRVPTRELRACRTWLPFWWRDEPLEPEREWRAADAEACEWVIRELELWVAEHAVDRVFIHAGAVAIDGKALLLPGRSFVGKSTLVAALLRAGADYLSDEYAVLDADGLVHAYPRPIALRKPDGTRSRVAANDLGAKTLDGPLPVAAIASLHHELGAEPMLQSMGAGEAVLRLVDNAVAARSASERVLEASVAAVDGATTIHGARGDADAAAARLIDLLFST